MKWIIIIGLLVGYVAVSDRLVKVAEEQSANLTAVYSLALEEPAQLLQRAEQIGLQNE